MREQLQVYELLRRLRDDPYFRAVWVDNEVEQRVRAGPEQKKDECRDILTAYLNEFDFKICWNHGCRPVIHISPKTFRGKPYSLILGILSKNLSTCLNTLIESAVKDVIHGYGKGSVLSGIFGKEYSRLFNSYIIKRMEAEFKR